MTIETKANLGDNVFFMKDNRVCEGKVKKIYVAVDQRETGIHYSIESVSHVMWESQIFPSKEELLKSI